MSGELRKPRTLMRPRRRLGRLLANVSAAWNNGIAKHAWRCSMKRRWFALIGLTGLLFPPVITGDYSTSLCVRAPGGLRSPARLCQDM
jgi:hypothetical protein